MMSTEREGQSLSADDIIHHLDPAVLAVLSWTSQRF